MSLQEAIEELKNQIKEGERPEEEALEEEAEKEEEEEKPEQKEEAEKEPEEKKEEPKPEEKLDDSAYARLRREAAAAKKAAADAEARRLELEEENQRLKSGAESAPASEQVNDEIVELLEDRKIKRAAAEFQDLEAKFSAKVADYADVSAEYAKALFQSNKIQNPRMSDAAILEKTQKDILFKAANYMREGFDPIEELYHEAKELGFTGKTKQKAEQRQEEKPALKPDMKKVAENRARSAGMAGTGGKSEPMMTKEFAATSMTVEEWSKLPPAEKKRLMYG